MVGTERHTNYNKKFLKSLLCPFCHTQKVLLLLKSFSNLPSAKAYPPFFLEILVNLQHKQKRFDRRMELSSGSAVGGVPLNDLPEECWANVLSFTTPRDVCRLSAVSPIFKSAAESDVVWQSFLPHDLESSLSTAPDGSLLMSSASSKKEVYFSLCDNPIIVDNGRKSFSLEKKSGKKCYVLSARDLEITGDNPIFWTWNSISDSRFAEVAELINVCLFEIRGKISICLLSPETLYTAYLVYKFAPGTYGFDNQPVDVTMRLNEGEFGARTVSWNSQRRCWHNGSVTVRGSVHYPKERGDGWLETELGDFFSAEGKDGELEMRLFDDTGHWKRGLILDGIEIRPKDGLLQGII